MSWPFQTTVKKNTEKNQQDANQPGFFERLLGAKQANKGTQQSFKAAQANNPVNQWNMPDEAFDAVAQLLEETKQKAPNQPLTSNPYRTSLILDDEPATGPQAAMPENKKQWQFDANDITFSKKKIIEHTGSHVHSSRPCLQPVQKPVEKQVLEEITEDTIIALSQPALPSIELQAEDLLEDDYGLSQVPGSLANDVSLQTLIKENIITFISVLETKTNKPFEVLSSDVSKKPTNPSVNSPITAVDPVHTVESIQPAQTQIEIIEQPINVSDELGWFTPSDNSLPDMFAMNETQTQSIEPQSADDWFSQGLDTQNTSLLDSEFIETEVIEAVVDETMLNQLTPPPEESASIILSPTSDDEDVEAEAIFSQGIDEQYEPLNISDTALLDDVPFAEAPIFSLEESTEHFNTTESEGFGLLDDLEQFEDTLLEEDNVIELANDSKITSDLFFSDKYQFSIDNLDSAELESPQENWQELSKAQEPLFAENSPILEGESFDSLWPINNTEPTVPVQLVHHETNVLPLDLDEDVQVYQDYLVEQIELPLEPIENLDEPLFDFSAEPNTSFDEKPLVTEQCLQPPPLPLIDVQAEKALLDEVVKHPHIEESLGVKMLFQECRFVKGRIDYLVESYFSNNPE